MKAYMLQMVQAINEDDNEPNFTFCGEFLNSTFCLLHAGFLLGLLLELKDGGHTFPTRPYTTEDRTIYSHRSENLKSNTVRRS
jgi:hypothetical protein